MVSQSERRPEREVAYRTLMGPQQNILSGTKAAATATAAAARAAAAAGESARQNSEGSHQWAARAAVASRAKMWEQSQAGDAAAAAAAAAERWQQEMEMQRRLDEAEKAAAAATAAALARRQQHRSPTGGSTNSRRGFRSQSKVHASAQASAARRRRGGGKTKEHTRAAAQLGRNAVSGQALLEKRTLISQERADTPMHRKRPATESGPRKTIHSSMPPLNPRPASSVAAIASRKAPHSSRPPQSPDVLYIHRPGSPQSGSSGGLPGIRSAQPLDSNGRLQSVASQWGLQLSGEACDIGGEQSFMMIDVPKIESDGRLLGTRPGCSAERTPSWLPPTTRGRSARPLSSVR